MTGQDGADDTGEQLGAMRLSTARGRWILTASVLGSGLAMLDATIVNVALPSIGRALSTELAGLQWIVNGYALTLAALILLGGSLADRFGRRRVFLVGVCWFALASLLCALAPTIPVLIAARALQGIGGALLTPGALAILSATFHPDDRARAIGAWAGLGGIASALGPFLGGALLTIDWRLIFLVNLPAAGLVLAVTLRHVPESSDASAPRRLDLSGAVLGALGLAGVTYALTAASDTGWATSVGVLGAVGLLGLLGFVLNERRTTHPMLPLDIFSSRQFSAANTVTFAMYAALGAVMFLLVIHLQVSTGFSPLAAGTALLPVTVLMLLFSARAGSLATRIGPRGPMTLGPLISAAGLVLMLRIGPDAGYVTEVLPAVVVFGIGLTTTVAPLTATALAAAAARHAGVASGVNNAVARTASLVAVAVLPGLAGLSGDVYTDPVAFTAGFRTAMLVAAGLLVLAGGLSAAGIRNDVLATEPSTEPATEPTRDREAERRRPQVPRPLLPQARRAARRYQCGVDAPVLTDCSAQGRPEAGSAASPSEPGPS